MSTRHDCLTPPPDNTPDREEYDRFADFLRITAKAPRDEHGCWLVTDETKRYAHGEEVAPTAIDNDHPARWSLLGTQRHST